jgi:formate hydrogenlyase transcriptional activator
MALRPGEQPCHFPSEAPVAGDPIRRGPEKNEDWYRDLVQHSQDLFSVHDLEGRFLSINPLPAHLLGYSVEEVLGKPMREFIPARFQAEFDVYLQQIATTGESHGLLTVLTSSGEERVWEYHNTLRTGGMERPLVRGVAHDVTDRVRAERALLKSHEKLQETALEQQRLLRELTLFRALLDQSNDSLQIVDPTTLRLLDVNERTCVELGYSREELLGMTIFDISPGFDEKARAAVGQQLDVTGSAIIERVHRRKDGTTFLAEVNLRRVHLDRVYGVSITRDITARKQTEERLQEFERVVENLEEMIVVINRDYRYVLANRGILRYRGLTKEEVLGRSIWEIMGDDLSTSVVKEKLDECFAGKVVNYELKQQFPAMGERYIAITYLPVEGPAGIDRVACVLRDVTDEKRAERALEASEASARAKANELTAVLDTVPVAVCIAHDAECRRMTGNRAAQDHLGVRDGHNLSLSASPEERPKFRILENGSELPPDQLPMQQTGATGKPESGRKLTVLLEDGSRRETIANAVALLDEDGAIRGVVGTSIDVTDLKRAECDLRESEMRFRAVYERSPVGIALVDSRTGCFLQVNPKFCEIAGRRKDELLGVDVASITHPDDVAVGKEHLRGMAEEKLGGYDMEKRYVRPDGSVRWVRILVVPMWSKGETRRWQMGLVEDITEHREAEQALQQSEERFRVALKDSPIAVFNQDRDLRYTWAYNSQLSSSSGERPGKPLEDFLEPEEAARITEIRRGVLASGVGVRDEIQVDRDGKKRYFNTTIEPVFDAAGNVVGLTGASMDVTELRNVTEALREAKKRLTEEKLYLEHEIDSELGFGEIIGKSKSLQTVMEMVGKVAASDATVLLLGETGSGKELVARAVHRLSARADSSFIKLNCAAIPSGLLESELFGHERGSFTGAITKKIGRIELADHGTLFLDEIGEISMDLQPKLLRVLQDQEFERLGGVHTLKVNFRLIAATNRDLAEGVRENEFRSDLYYRLNVFPIRVPPLRERRDDIPLLVEHFVRKCALRMHKSITSIPKKTLDALTGWDWPGNVRELENFIERSVILTQGSVLVSPMVELQRSAEVPNEVDESLKAAERDHILRALRESHGQIGGLRGAAMRLGLKRTTLQSKLKQLGIDPRSRSIEN